VPPVKPQVWHPTGHSRRYQQGERASLCEPVRDVLMDSSAIGLRRLDSHDAVVATGFHDQHPDAQLHYVDRACHWGDPASTVGGIGFCSLSLPRAFRRKFPRHHRDYQAADFPP
jgi:hypothetical protein